MADIAADIAALEEALTTPTPEVVSDVARLEGDIVVLGVGGKVGPSVAGMAAAGGAGGGRRQDRLRGGPVLRSGRSRHPGAVRGGAGSRGPDRRRAARRAPGRRQCDLHGGQQVRHRRQRALHVDDERLPAGPGRAALPRLPDRQLLDAGHLPARGRRHRRLPRSGLAGDRRRVRGVVRGPRADVRALLAQERHPGAAVPARLLHRDALRRAAGDRPGRVRRHPDPARHGPRQRDLAARRRRVRHPLAAPRGLPAPQAQHHRPGDRLRAQAGRAVRRALRP